MIAMPKEVIKHVGALLGAKLKLKRITIDMHWTESSYDVTFRSHDKKKKKDEILFFNTHDSKTVTLKTVDPDEEFDILPEEGEQEISEDAE